MKKIILVTILIGIPFLLIKSNEPITEEFEKQKEMRAIFISYIELQEHVKNQNQQTSKKNIDKMLANIKKLKFNTVILQVRMASDAIYPSKIFPYSNYVSREEGEEYYDVLQYFLDKSHRENLKLYAWINPYRIRTTEKKETISKKNPAYQYLGTDTIYINNGIYYNPSKKEVTNLIVSGVKEVLKYQVDGILFDDYFYPNTEIDEADYQKYLETNSYISGEEYRLNVINEMLEKVHVLCKKYNIPFGVSPDGNIENNYQKNYADIKKWLSSDKYVDFIMPQIYYGFYNSTKSYFKVVREWHNLLKKENINFYVALAFYKVGIEDKYAKEGYDEWLTNDDIIMREVLLSRNLEKYSGFSLFRYDNLFNTNNYTSTSIKEIENLKKILK